MITEIKVEPDLQGDIKVLILAVQELKRSLDELRLEMAYLARRMNNN